MGDADAIREALESSWLFGSSSTIHSVTVPRGSRDMGGETAEVRIDHLFNGRLGVRLRMEGLLVSGFEVPEAANVGWRLKDEILAVNGVPVQMKEDFSRELAKGCKCLPITFTVRRGGTCTPGTPSTSSGRTRRRRASSLPTSSGPVEVARCGVDSDLMSTASW